MYMNGMSPMYPMNGMQFGTQYEPRQQTQQPQSSSDLIRVFGFDGAKAFQMPPNSKAPLFDELNQGYMYIKSTDGAGYPDIKTFKITEINNNVPAQANYVDRGEFDLFKKEMTDYVDQLFPNTAKTNTNAGRNNGNGKQSAS